MPQQFQTRVEANIRNKHYTITAEEYFDGPGNRASLWMLQNNSQNALIYDYANNQILYVVRVGQDFVQFGIRIYFSMWGSVSHGRKS
ncbi:hypothetical protein CHS0354_010648 [Potamilus streckersoni]|uniref:Uncharacterized protein n=1 Tax=Potamilus streckersoni TaxID=2493646 RepID=A0AAE0TCE4_9BIVA|nr:hypothetical protein CHS0354_010648 [Potamilus streckersoni]